MADIIAQLQVLSKESGCLLDLTALIDLSICPKIDILTPGHHHTEHDDDHVYVTPTEDKSTPQYGRRSCKDGACYEMNHEVCKKSSVSLDLELLVVIGLLTEKELEDYCKTTGAIGEHDCVKVDECDVKMDPLLSVGLGDTSLLNLDLLSEGGLLSLDVLGGGCGKKGLLDLDVLGEKDKDESAIDIDILTHESDDDEEECKGDKKHDDMISHYQPICKKAFKKESRDKAHHCHANDVNHCLAICNAESALLTINADVKVGDVADIQLCVAIEFDQSSDEDNCHFFVAPEHEPCTEDDLEDSDECYTFFRN